MSIGKKGMNRRNFFKVAAASGAAAAVAGCSDDPIEDLIPILVPPDHYTPGVSVYYATVCQECPSQCGMHIRTREGRALKAEGNPNHPFNQGGLCGVGQASLQGLYNPSRVRYPTSGKGNAKKITWKDGKEQLVASLKKLKDEGKGKRVLYFGRPNSGTLQQLVGKVITGIGGQTIAFDMASTDNSIVEANKRMFGKEEVPFYNVANAKVLVNFGADFMESWGKPVEFMKDFAKMHGYKNKKKGKFIHVSPHLSMTGSSADQWVECKTGDEVKVALAVANSLLTKSSTYLSITNKQRIAEYLKDYTPANVAKETGVPATVIEKIAKELGTNGSSLAIGGGTSTANGNATALQVAVNLINFIARNYGRTVQFGSKETVADSMATVEKAIQDMKSGNYDVVIIDNVNPVYALPKSAGFDEALSKVATVVSLSTIHDETSAKATLHLPVSHFLETWGDSNTRDGIYGLQQPVMGQVTANTKEGNTIPFFDTIPAGDLFLEVGSQLKLAGITTKEFRTYLSKAWESVQKTVSGTGTFASFWDESLKNGGVFRSRLTSSSVSLQTNALSIKPKATAKKSGLTLLAVNSVFHDANGYGGDKPWLLEVPHPVTQIVWDSWVEIHPDTAQALKIRHGEKVKLTVNGNTIELPAWVYHGVQKDTVVVPTGFGRSIAFPSYSTYKQDLFIPTAPGNPDKLKEVKVGENIVDLLPLEKDQYSGDFSFAGTEVKIEGTGKKAFVVMLDGAHRDDLKGKLISQTKAGEGDRGQRDRGFIQTASLKELKGLSFGQKLKPEGHHLKQRLYTNDKTGNLDKNGKKRPGQSATHDFYKPMERNVQEHAFGLKGNDTPKYYDPYRWEMAIDLDRCTGCSACVVACFAENNLPVVGKERQAVGREMAWLRIERFFDRDKSGAITTNFSPEMCSQCGNAGCETVCPVYATYHNPEGLNAMVYNRCVGTRYCSNNCAYKARRFNWRTYTFPKPLTLQLNPDVTVRSKGVMEKCTFCVQRIREQKDLAKDKGQLVVTDGAIQTACQQTCPTGAITFGNGVSKTSQVAKIKNQTKRGYTQLAELNYKPAITYLKKVKHDA
ncbi:MAG: anaerobic selenocysteine-containing dehydrogenase/Fe-S-cluster-containing dehydrogenase component [bacterium]|jgi:anaerobic selenocysteine-containing dehydrogenase/Fe-S-cluster-containing dehydrogenase component